LRTGFGRRSVPHLVLGVLLVTACVTGAVLWSITTGERRAALALARDVTVGQTLAAADLREVSVALDGEVDAIAASDAGSVIGQPIAASLPAGALLPRAALGAPPLPAPGDAVAALALPAGQVPPDVTAGAHVLIVLGADPNNATSAPAGSSADSGWPAVITNVASTTTDQTLVVSALLREDDARRVAAAPPGRLAIVIMPATGRR
jgi:hypothetical protein